MTIGGKPVQRLSFAVDSIHFILHVCLCLDQWLNACIAIERTMTIIKATRFDRKKSRQAAKFVQIILLVISIASYIHDPIHRRLIDEGNNDAYDDDGDNVKRTWCTITGLQRRAGSEMVKEIQTIIHIAFPNLEECDEDENFVQYLKGKMRKSRLRIFRQVISKDTGSFLPNNTILRMPDVEFNQLCSISANYRSKHHWWWNLRQI